MDAGTVAVVVALTAAVYETVAHFSRRMPYITTLVNKLPWGVRVAMLAGSAAWSVDHFEVWNFMMVSRP